MAEAPNLNPIFPTAVADELKRREGANELRDDFFKYWNYKKYCYVNVSIIAGETGTVLTAAEMKIGDSTAPTGGGTSLYDTEGPQRKFKPILTSVKITNNGGGDYTEALIYETEVSFKVYTLAQLEKVQKSFFILGAKMKIEYGWRDHTNPVDGVTNGFVDTNVYNFSFSIESDGAYSCNVKAISASALFSQTAGGTETAEKEPGNEGKDTESDLISQLKTLYKKAFGIDEDEDASDAGVGDGDIEQKTSEASATTFQQKLDFYTGNIENGEFFTLEDSIFVPYIRLGSLIDYFNGYLGSGGTAPIKLEFAAGKAGKYEYHKGFGSASPDKFVLQGAACQYNEAGGTLDWSSTLTDTSQTLGSILVSIDVIQKIFDDLQTDADDERDIKTQSVKITSILNKIFKGINTETGNLVNPKLMPAQVEPNSKSETDTILIINRNTVINASESFPDPHPFSAVGEKSIGVRSISLESDFDSDLLILASTKAIEDGTSNVSKLASLYPDDTKLAAAVEKAKSKSAANDTEQKLLTAKQAFGDQGYTPERSSAYRNAMSTFISRNPDKTPFSSGAFSELPLLLNLSVTLDGINGITYMSPITVDRLPGNYKNKKVSFSVISVEHSFDCQGDWETSLGTVMRIR
jgi:hypothetical protein